MDSIKPLGDSFFFEERLEYRLEPRGLGTDYLLILRVGVFVNGRYAEKGNVFLYHIIKR